MLDKRVDPWLRRAFPLFRNEMTGMVRIGDKVVVGGVWKGEICTVLADMGATWQVSFEGSTYVVRKDICERFPGEVPGVPRRAHLSRKVRYRIFL